jgi:hypothetical protein
MVGIDTGIRGISLSVYTYQKLPSELNHNIEQLTLSREALQD